jgi:hypothetical protein
MTKNIIKQLAEESFNKNDLDEKKIHMITARLKRADARSYVRALKLLTQQKTVFVHAPVVIDATEQKQLQVKFPNKKIVYTINKDLLAGMRIVDNDLLYDYSLEAKFDKIAMKAYDTND